MTSLALFALLVALNVADVLLTLAILQRGGREVNPVMRWCIEQVGPRAGLTFPKAVLLAVLWVVLHAHPGMDTLVVLVLLCALYVWVVVRNARVLKRMRAPF